MHSSKYRTGGNYSFRILSELCSGNRSDLGILKNMYLLSWQRSLPDTIHKNRTYLWQREIGHGAGAGHGTECIIIH